ncbi:hypothetical protein ACQKWADRAFT_249366 [Trichoderma austrokoningii]
MSSSSGSSSSMIRIAVALYRRDPYSSDPKERQFYGHAAYHWGILIVLPDGGYDAYAATDRNEIDWEKGRQENASGDWWFYARRGVDPKRSGKLLGSIIIGTAPSTTKRDDFELFLRQVPLPIKNMHPQQDCVTWIGNAIRKLRDEHYAADFKVGKFLDWALLYADQRLWHSEETKEVVDYIKETEKGTEKGKKKK